MKNSPEFSSADDAPAPESDGIYSRNRNQTSNESDIKYPEMRTIIRKRRKDGQNAITFSYQSKKDREYNETFNPTYVPEIMIALQVYRFIHRVSMKDAIAMTDAFERGIKEHGEEQGIKYGAAVTIRRLSRILNIKEEPSFEYLPDERKKYSGEYNSEENKIYLYSPHRAFTTIAHEIFHAHQRDTVKHATLNTKKKREYELAMDDYKSPQEYGDEVYKGQRMEREAEAFAIRVTKRIEEMYHPIDFGDSPSTTEEQQDRPVRCKQFLDDWQN